MVCPAGQRHADRSTRTASSGQNRYVLVMVVVVIVVIMMAMIVVVAMIFMIPVAFVHTPAFLVVVVVRMGPVGAGIRRAIPAAWNPDVTALVDSPVAIDPGIAFARDRWACFITQWGRCSADVDANLPKHGHG